MQGRKQAGEALKRLKTFIQDFETKKVDYHLQKN